MRTTKKLSKALLGAVLALGAVSGAYAQDSTGFLGIAGVVSNSGGAGVNGVTVRIRNAATNRTEVTTTPSTANAAAGFYFVALSDFSGNRAARVGDVLNITAEQSGAAVGITPATTTVTAADVSSSLLRLNLRLTGQTAVDNTPPVPTLSYSPSGVVQPGGSLTINAQFNETVTGTVQFKITGPTGSSSTVATQSSGTNRFSASITASTTQGNYTVEVTGAKDTAQNNNAAAVNATFLVKSGTPTPSLAIGSVTASPGADGKVDVSLANVPGSSVGAVQFKITFDNTKLQFKSAEAGSAAVASGYSAAANEANPGVLNVTVFGITDAALGSGPIASVTFTVRATATVGPITLTGSEPIASDLAGNPITGTTISNGTFTVGTATATGGCEDVDRNGSVNILDLRRVVNVILGTRTATTEDVDGNGSVNILDLRRVVNVILGTRVAATCP